MMNLKKREAVYNWVKGFNSVKQSLITKAYPYLEADGFNEITPTMFGTGDSVNYCGSEYLLGEDTYLSVLENKGDTLVLELTDEGDVETYGESIEVDITDCENADYNREDGLPMWGYLWTLDSTTESWVRDNLYKMADMGFRIYEDEEAEIFIGIDGCGYDFYEAHWTPFYEAYMSQN